jgi:hypothetical protein
MDIVMTMTIVVMIAATVNIAHHPAAVVEVNLPTLGS